MNTITFTRVSKQRTKITGFTDGDLRLIALGLEAGAFQAGDQGGEHSQALLRLAKAFRTPTMYPGPLGNITIVGNSRTPVHMYEDIENLPAGVTAE